MRRQGPRACAPVLAARAAHCAAIASTVCCCGLATSFRRDDIDAFVLQVEGSKRWRLYAHTDPQNVLPRCAWLPWRRGLPLSCGRLLGGHVVPYRKCVHCGGGTPSVGSLRASSHPPTVARLPARPPACLRRHSSRDFADDELGECVLDVVLQVRAGL